MSQAGKSGFWFQVFWQALSLFLMAALLGILLNMARSVGLPLLAVRFQETGLSSRPDHASEITLDEAFAAFSSGTCIFLDARSPEAYAEGHIPGALNLPWNEFEERYNRIIGPIPWDALVITYCDGEGCPLGDYLAMELFLEGYAYVRVLTSGWLSWVERGFPYEKGYPLITGAGNTSEKGQYDLIE